VWYFVWIQTGIPEEGFFGNRFSPKDKFPERRGFKNYRFWVTAGSFEQAEAKICSCFRSDLGGEPFSSRSYVKGPFTKEQKDQMER